MRTDPDPTALVLGAHGALLAVSLVASLGCLVTAGVALSLAVVAGLCARVLERREAREGT